jgi:hypothetical protein
VEFFSGGWAAKTVAKKAQRAIVRLMRFIVMTAQLWGGVGLMQVPVLFKFYGTRVLKRTSEVVRSEEWQAGRQAPSHLAYTL